MPLQDTSGTARADDWRAAALRAHIARVGAGPLLMVRGEWTAQAEAALEVLLEADGHGLDLSPPIPAPQTLRDAAARAQRSAQAAQALPPYQLTPQDWDTLTARLIAQGLDPSSLEASVQVRAMLAPDAPDNPLPAVAAWWREADRLRAQWAADVAAFEHLVVPALLTVAHRQQLAYPQTAPALSPWASLRGLDLVRVRAAHLLDTLPLDAAALVAQAWPPHPQYTALGDARRRYAALAAAGGWPTLTFRSRLRAGERHPLAAALRQRLALEGYAPPNHPDPDLVDEPLRAAVLRYQRTHQLDEDGVISQSLIDNLNIPASRRLAQIDVTMQRMREAVAGAFTAYLVINLPAFTLALWRDGAQVERHRIVIGSTKVIAGHSNRTPLMPVRFIEEVVYNPYWNVPGRIEDEIDGSLRGDPAAWYRSRGYERVDAGLASERWRQKPGPNNVLGRVKFQFTNPHNVYLHDTKEKYYFKFPLRAYSHGCMRVQDPLDLAERLLTADGQYDPAWVDEVLNKRRPYKQEVVSLKRPVPLHIVYWNVQVDPEDGVMFLRDIYGLDIRPVKARMQALGLL